MNGQDLALVLGAGTAFVGALGALVYISPARAWKMLAESSRDQVKDLGRRVDRLEDTVAQRDRAIEQRDGVIRRLRSIRSVLENLLHQHGIAIPVFLEDDHPEVAPERRSPTVSAATASVVVEPDQEHR